MIDVSIQILTAVFRALVNIFFIGVFFKNQQKSNIKILFLILGFSVFSSFSVLNFDTLTVYFILNTFFIILLSFSYKGILQRKIVAATALLVFTILCDSFIYSIFNHILGYKIPYYILNMIISGSIFIFANLLNTFFTSYYTQELSLRKLTLVIGAPFSSLAIFILSYISNPDKSISAYIAFFLIILNIFIFYSYNIILKSTNIEFENQILEVSNKAYRAQMNIISQTRDETLRLKHDINNHILSMRHLIRNKEYSKVDAHLSDITKEIKEDKIFSKSGNVIIDAILNYKLSLIANLNTDISCDIKLPCEDFISLFDLTIIFGNLLDNVYEALKITTNRKLILNISYEKGMLFINCKNTFAKAPTKINNTYLSIKKDKSNHGFGLKNIAKVVDKYNGENQIIITETFFIQEILLFTKL